MSDHLDPTELPADDDELLGLLRVAHNEFDPPPDGLTAAANRALTWDTELAELVPLVFDSAGSEFAMRGDGERHDLTFELGDIILEVEIVQTGADTVLVGAIDPAGADLLIEQPGVPPASVDSDNRGRFRNTVSGAAARFVVVLPDGRRLRTELFSFAST